MKNKNSERKEQLHVGQHLENVCEKCLEFTKEWSFISGEYNMAYRLQKEILKQSGVEYANGNDEMAERLRELAKSWDSIVSKSEERLKWFIRYGSSNGEENDEEN